MPYRTFILYGKPPAADRGFRSRNAGQHKEEGNSLLVFFFSSHMLCFGLLWRTYVDMERQYSILELTKYDETARAPDRDYDATTLDPNALAPHASS